MFLIIAITENSDMSNNKCLCINNYTWTDTHRVQYMLWSLVKIILPQCGNLDPVCTEIQYCIYCTLEKECNKFKLKIGQNALTCSRALAVYVKIMAVKLPYLRAFLNTSKKRRRNETYPYTWRYSKYKIYKSLL